MLNRNNFLVADFTSKKESRYSTRAILVRPDATVATNGHYLAWMSTAKMSPESFPQIEGFAGGQIEFKPFLLDTESAKAIAKGLPKKTSIPVLNYAAVNVQEIEGKASVSMAITDLERPSVFRPRVPDGQFPNFEAVIPNVEDTHFEITVDAEYLQTIAKAYATFLKHSKNAPVRMRFQAHRKGKDLKGVPRIEPQSIRFDATDGTQGMTVVLMPMRYEGDVFATYGWQAREDKRQADAKAAEEAKKASLAETAAGE